MRRLARVGSVMVVLLALLVACGGAATPQPGGQPASDGSPVIQLADGERLRIAFVYISPIGDLGWTWAHNEGRLVIEKAFGSRVETNFVENVPENGPEAVAAIRDFAEQGYHVIFTTSFGLMDPTIEVAEEFPNTWFIHISGYKSAPNVSTVFGRMEIPRYLSGIVAGRATENNKLGYVAAFDIPEVVRGINAFTLGVRSVQPEAEVHVRYTQTWFDPELEGNAAQALLDEGADVLAQHQDSRATSLAAQAAGAYSIGYDSDMSRFAGESVLTSPIWNWGPKYVSIVQQIFEGTYQSESYYGSDIVGLAPFSFHVDYETRAMVAAQDKAIRAGEADVFCGPIYSNTEVLVVAEGRCLTDTELLSMDWYVEGVVGEAPGEAKTGLGEASSKVPAWTSIEE
jgi:basic membrane protein A and related proteins